jgi:localization factor PodJL
MRNLLLPLPAGRDPWPQSRPSAGPGLAAAPLPPAIGGKTLIAAAQAGDPGASYEIAVRFAQGHNAAPDFVKAAAWLERATQAGLAPAQFRLGSMYEKGLGVRKNVAEARRLYVEAAAKGHAKAMHNLAVLYTRGINGAPDYGAAAEWFRKAAAYGTVDSQYNLAILYARGTGVERDLGESYKWFALAAKGGDKDAAHKRDEVARGLDPKQLEAAKASAEAFVATPQPNEANDVRAPAGGWDPVAAPATSKPRTPARPERSPGR